jgi:ATP-dependent Clp protease ATP-binding subunit ClpC
MFERFTSHARRVLQLEGMEANRMHHAYLGTEHMLLALVREPEGHGHRALESVGLNLKQVRQAVAELVEEGPDTEIPDHFHQTPHIKHVMAVALEEARRLKHGHIGTEHLLLALLNEKDGVAVRALDKLDVRPEALRDEILDMLEKEHAAPAGE